MIFAQHARSRTALVGLGQGQDLVNSITQVPDKINAASDAVTGVVPDIQATIPLAKGFFVVGIAAFALWGASIAFRGFKRSPA